MILNKIILSSALDLICISFSTFAEQLNDKENFLQILSTRYNIKTVDISLKEEYKPHISGDTINFTVSHSNYEKGTLTVFNINSNNELEYLYPSKLVLPLIHQLPTSLLPIIVTEPYGNEHLIVILCKKTPNKLDNLLSESGINIPNPNEIISKLQGENCQMGSYEFLTSEK